MKRLAALLLFAFSFTQIKTGAQGCVLLKALEAFATSQATQKEEN